MFLNEWAEEGIEGVRSDFKISDEELRDVEILLASYDRRHYQGTAFVLFKRGDKYYEVNGSHCSCHGLEGQWNPEEANIDELWNRVTDGSFGVEEDENIFSSELKQVLVKLRPRPMMWL